MDERLAVVLGGEVDTGGVLERLLMFLHALLLQAAKFGDFFFATAGEAGFLELEIAELLVIGFVGVEFDEGGAMGGIGFGEQVGEFFAAFGVEGLLEVGDAADAPGAVGDGLQEFGFKVADGFEFLLVGGDVALVFGDVV